MICPACREKIEDGRRVCPLCGFEIDKANILALNKEMESLREAFLDLKNKKQNCIHLNVAGDCSIVRQKREMEENFRRSVKGFEIQTCEYLDRMKVLARELKGVKRELGEAYQEMSGHGFVARGEFYNEEVGERLKRFIAEREENKKREDEAKTVRRHFYGVTKIEIRGIGNYVLTTVGRCAGHYGAVAPLRMDGPLLLPDSGFADMHDRQPMMLRQEFGFENFGSFMFVEKDGVVEMVKVVRKTSEKEQDHR